METMRWRKEEDVLELLDQTKLPGAVKYIRCDHYRDVAGAIKILAVRGAPAIGAAAAYGLVLGVKGGFGTGRSLIERAVEVADKLASVRPTAVNLRWALDRLLDKIADKADREPSQLYEILLSEAHEIHEEDYQGNRAMGAFGQGLIPDGAGILTHCNAGALATAGYGTALGVIRAAHEAGKKLMVYADETRPLLQGSRLTAWEMMQEKIPVRVITDSMAGYLMSQGKVDCVIVGADRIAANGDVANKIGTYSVAVLAKYHGIPFYVAAPLSTIDFSLENGGLIPIEEREESEVTQIHGVGLAPKGVRAWNPAFDVTPGQLIGAIITDLGVARQPYTESLGSLVTGN
ncbi:MAG TPA: S-methyl-5-thioribose-1-phosphate isomerase [Clostridia bacterium]|nr:S-methyl-5-thioribose-1-phosphate isomerase [Clostridia bacterium]